MSSEVTPPVTIFWSWQSDSPHRQNRSFIEECIRKAAKKIAKENLMVINIDRDTKNVGGTPGIADTILTKIRDADLFIWDATFVYSEPRLSPNANVLIEFGYALATLGSGRIISIMNTDDRKDADKLPFDLRHRRWPITYSLATPQEEASLADIEEFKRVKKDVESELVDSLSIAILEALKEDKSGAFVYDGDYVIAKKLWEAIDSEWIYDWMSYREANIQYEEKGTLHKIYRYVDASRRPEFQFKNAKLSQSHAAVVKALKGYAYASATQRIPNGDTSFVISVKLQGYVKDYDAIYDRQVRTLLDSIDVLRAAWIQYVGALREAYPEIVY